MFGNACYSLDRLVISQYVGSENTEVISKTSNTITLASNPFQANGGNIITWPLTDNNTAGVPVSNFCQFSTNSGAFFATGLVNNSDGSCTLTRLLGAMEPLRQRYQTSLKLSDLHQERISYQMTPTRSQQHASV